jgi:hypothetical protein
MTVLDVTRPVAASSTDAPTYLEQWFYEQGNGETAVLALRASIALPGLPKLALARDCVVRLERMPNADTLHVEYRVSWESAGGGPFPTFAGRLTIESSDGPDAAVIALQGAYDPPFGSAGRAFDLAIGHTIADSCARELLERISVYVEQASRGVGIAKTIRSLHTRL